MYFCAKRPWSLALVVLLCVSEDWKEILGAILKKPTHGTGARRLTTEAHNDPPRPPNNVGDCYRGGGIDDGAACASVECGSRLVDVRNLGVAAPIEVKCEM